LTRLNFYVRSGSGAQNMRNWSDSIPVRVGVQNDGVDLADYTQSGDRYFQYKVKMGGRDTAPVVREVSVSFDDMVPDAAVLEILSPTGVVDSGSTAIPAARLRNFYDQPATFPVYMRVSPPPPSQPTYEDTVNVVGMPGPSDTVVTFGVWHPIVRGNHAVKCTTALVGDQRPGNNYKTATVLVRVRDVGATAIVAPAGSVPSGRPLLPQAKVRNYGNCPENFSVLFRIGGVYEDTIAVTGLSGGRESLVCFTRNWTPVQGSYVTACSTMMAFDVHPENDKTTDSVDVFLRMIDIGVESIIAPRGTFPDQNQVAPRVAFHNYGNTGEVFSAVFRITDSLGATVYTDTRTGLALQPQAGRTDTFRRWTARLGDYLVSCSTRTANDTNPANDKRTDSLHVVRSYDVGVLRILSPTGRVDSGFTTIQPVVDVRNYCAYPSTFPVYFRIGTFYFDTLQIDSLLPGATRRVTFRNLLACLPRGIHAAKCSTGMSQDENRANDTLSSLITATVHDVSTLQILSPPASPDPVVFVGDAVIPQAQDSNPGTEDASPFSAFFTVAGLYSQSCPVTLAAGTKAVVSFPPWTIQDAPGTYPTACSTAWGLDRNPFNDRDDSLVVVKRRTMLLAPNRWAWVLPGDSCDDTLVVTNTGQWTDTADIETTGHRRNGWQFKLYDSTGQTELTDLDGNGIPDIGPLPCSTSASFILRAFVPAGETALVEDTTVVTARSTNDPLVYDTKSFRLRVRIVTRFTLSGDSSASVRSGDTAKYLFTLGNQSNYPDCFDLSLASSQPDWAFGLQDSFGWPLSDQNGNGIPDVGPVGLFGGRSTFCLLVMPPDVTLPGTTDLTFVKAASGNSRNVTDSALVTTTALGSLHLFAVESDLTDHHYVGETRDYVLDVRTEGNATDCAELSVISDRTDWGVRLFNENGLQPLPDSNLDGRTELGPIVANSRKQFVVKVTAPNNVPANLAGQIESLTTCHIRVAGQSRFNWNLTDTVSLTLQVVPALAIHNFENPFSDRTRFMFSIPRDSKVRLYVYNLAGELVAKPIDNEFYAFGIHGFDWRATNDRGKKLAPGVYNYLIELTNRQNGDLTDRVWKKLVIR
jgi:hypothetical protein